MCGDRRAETSTSTRYGTGTSSSFTFFVFRLRLSVDLRSGLNCEANDHPGSGTSALQKRERESERYKKQ